MAAKDSIDLIHTTVKDELLSPYENKTYYICDGEGKVIEPPIGKLQVIGDNQNFIFSKIMSNTDPNKLETILNYNEYLHYINDFREKMKDETINSYIKKITNITFIFNKEKTILPLDAKICYYRSNTFYIPNWILQTLLTNKLCEYLIKHTHFFQTTKANKRLGKFISFTAKQFIFENTVLDYDKSENQLFWHNNKTLNDCVAETIKEGETSGISIRSTRRQMLNKLNQHLSRHTTGRTASKTTEGESKVGGSIYKKNNNTKTKRKLRKLQSKSKNITKNKTKSKKN